MAYKDNYRRNRKSNSKYCQLERLAYNLGKIERGLKNSNSRVHESYTNGFNGKTSSSNKPLI